MCGSRLPYMVPDTYLQTTAYKFVIIVLISLPLPGSLSPRSSQYWSTEHTLNSDSSSPSHHFASYEQYHYTFHCLTVYVFVFSLLIYLLPPSLCTGPARCLSLLLLYDEVRSDTRGINHHRVTASHNNNNNNKITTAAAVVVVSKTNQPNRKAPTGCNQQETS